jgi:hypothetical protein
MASFHNPLQNHLLAALPRAELQRGLPQLKQVAMPLGRERSSCRPRGSYGMRAVTSSSWTAKGSSAARASATRW